MRPSSRSKAKIDWMDRALKVKLSASEVAAACTDASAMVLLVLKDLWCLVSTLMYPMYLLWPVMRRGALGIN
jgi:hypothetical protein